MAHDVLNQSSSWPLDSGAALAKLNKRLKAGPENAGQLRKKCLSKVSGFRL